MGAPLHTAAARRTNRPLAFAARCWMPVALMPGMVLLCSCKEHKAPPETANPSGEARRPANSTPPPLKEPEKRVLTPPTENPPQIEKNADTPEKLPH